MTPEEWKLRREAWKGVAGVVVCRPVPARPVVARRVIARQRVAWPVTAGEVRRVIGMSWLGQSRHGPSLPGTARQAQPKRDRSSSKGSVPPSNALPSPASGPMIPTIRTPTIGAKTMSLSDTLNRADEALAAATRRQLDRMRAEDAAAEAAERERVRNDSFRRFEVAQRYADGYRAFGVETPAPIDGESVGRFRMRLYEGLRCKLPDNHDLADVRADDIPGGQAARNFEEMIIAAAKAEGERPSVENLPPGREVVRHRLDPATGERQTHFFARESFIKNMGQPGRQVVRFFDPRTRQVLFGPPLERY